MSRGSRSPAAYFNGADVGKVGHAQAGGASGGAGAKLYAINSASGPPSDAQPRGTPAGGTENMRADGKRMDAPHPGPSVTYSDSRPVEVKVSDGLSTPERIKR